VSKVYGGTIDDVTNRGQITGSAMKAFSESYGKPPPDWAKFSQTLKDEFGLLIERHMAELLNDREYFLGVVLILEKGYAEQAIIVPK